MGEREGESGEWVREKGRVERARERVKVGGLVRLCN